MRQNSMDLTARQSRVVSDTNLAPIIQILTWILLAFAVLTFATYTATKLAVRRIWGAPDVLLLVSLAIGAGQASTIFSPAGQIIGTLPDEHSQGDVQAGLESLYIGEILSVIALLSAKASVLAALWVITPRRGHRITIFLTSVVTILWALSAAFTIGFQCPAPNRWEVINTGCIDIRAAKTYRTTMDIVTDACLVIIPSVIIMSVQLSWSRKLTLMTGFWFRLVVIVVSVVNLVFIQQLVLDENYILNVWKITVCAEIVQSCSIATACIPFLKPFLMSLESGFLRADDANRRKESGIDGAAYLKMLGSSTYIKLRNQASWGALNARK
ncbi:hypothetical protein F4778DRAFT_776656 [Xylariomycetidae sp. FL2044]|nr:hypothetical protein F4778DRAFT_776656 [Xylariomycetidae sp. FL2044]